MKNVILVLAVFGLLSLAGCTTSALVRTPYHMVQGNTFEIQLHTPPDASEEGMTLLRNDLNTELASRSLLANAGSAGARVLDVNVTYYRMRPGAARALVGIMAGRDKIQSTITVKEHGGKVLSEYTVTSTNATAWGTAHGMIEKHAKEIVDTLAK